jgi:hypothetical protein
MADDTAAADGARARVHKPELVVEPLRVRADLQRTRTFASPPPVSRAAHALALQRTVGNAATRRILSGQVQRKLPKGLAAETPVVHHEEAGDVTGFKIVKSVIGNYTISGPDAKEYKGISGGNPDWGTEADKAASRVEWESVRAVKAAGAEAENLRKQLIVGENYLSADYRRINPLLAALERNGYTSPEVRDKAFDYSAKKPLILADMKEIALTRKYADEEGAAAWDEDEVDTVYRMLRTILDVWDKFPKPEGAGGTAIARVFRGDTRFLFDSFPRLNPALEDNGYDEGNNDVAVDVSMPGILSTTYGDPKVHNYVKGKTVVWDIAVPPGSEGKGLGTNNKSEEEMSFPIGTVLHVTTILVRRADKTAEADVYGPSAEVVLKAHI